MTEYGEIEFRKFYLGEKPTVDAFHRGNAIFRMTFEFWDQAHHDRKGLFVGNVFKICGINVQIISVIHEERLVVCVNKDKPFWRIASLFYKIRKLKK